MTIYYNATDRKPLIKAISEFTGAKPVYLKTPTYAYQIDYFTVTREGNLEFDDMADLGAIVAEIKAMGASIYEVDIDRFRSNCADKPSAVISLRLPHRQIRTHLLTALAQTPSVRTVEEL